MMTKIYFHNNRLLAINKNSTIYNLLFDFSVECRRSGGEFLKGTKLNVITNFIRGFGISRSH